MTDSYQPIYDAIRSRIGGVNVSEVIERAAREAFDLGMFRHILQEEAVSACREYQRPSAVYRPTLSADGSMWCALLGDNLQTGVAGFGETPEKAMAAFDQAFWKERTPAAQIAARKLAEPA